MFHLQNFSFLDHLQLHLSIVYSNMNIHLLKCSTDHNALKGDLPVDSWPTLSILMRHTFSGSLSLTQVEIVEFASKSQEGEHHYLGQQDTWHNEMLTVQGLCMYNVNEKKVMA